MGLVEKIYMRVKGLRPFGAKQKDLTTLIKGRSFCSNCHNLIREAAHKYKGATLCKKCYLKVSQKA